MSNLKTEVDFSSDDENYEDAKVINQEDNNQVITELLGENEFVVKNTNLLQDNPLKNNTNEEIFSDCETDTDVIDEDSQRDFEKTLTDDEKLANKEKAEDFKNIGNESFKNGEYEESIKFYTDGLKICPLDYKNERSILYANRAAAKTKLNLKESAIEDCSKAIEYNDKYLKPLLRRAKLYEETDKLDESLGDFKKILELDGNVIEAKQALIYLPPKIQERNEKLKDEMIGKLKDLGNMILKPFGLSTTNFQMQQDPQSGSYSINFNQNK